MEYKYIKIETFIPEEYVKKLRESLNSIGALTIGGNYDNCISVSKVTGTWRPLDGAHPYNGEIGEICEAEECKVEFTCRKEILKKTVAVIKEVHPYEVPVINVLPVLDLMEL